MKLDILTIIYKLWILLAIIPFSVLQKTNIGLIYETDNPVMENIFQLAIDNANQQNDGLRLNGIAAGIEPGNAFEASKKLCKMLGHNLVAVFGPTSNVAARHSMSICDAKELPFIDVRSDLSVQLPTVNLYPHQSQMGNVLKDLVNTLEWESFTIIYESAEFLPLVNDLLQMYGTSGPTVVLRRYELDLNGNYRNVLRRVRNSGETSFVIVGSMKTLPNLFQQAQQVGLMTSAYRYIIGNLDIQTMELEPYQHSDANITCIRLIAPENEQVYEVSKALYESDDPYMNVSCPLSVSMALIYDGVQLLAETFNHVMFHPVSLNCNDDTTWNKGYTLVNYMKSLTMNGLSGDIKFDYEGLRTDFKLDILELTVSGMQKIGTWKSDEGVTIERPSTTIVVEQDQRSLVNKSFIVITAISEPYGMLKDSPVNLEGNDQFEGFGIELIEELGKKLGFSYTFRLQEDNKYGSKHPVTGEWNGMILEIMEGRADLGITDLTMTSDRESAVDFTIPFMNLGIAILFRKPMKEPPKLFSFMSPFSGEVWLCLGVAYVSVSLCMFIMSRISPAEWDNPYPCIEEPTQLENQFSLANCFWWSIGAVLQQGSELAPKAYSTRSVASFWAFFTLILVSSYTANLAAFLTVESLSTPIENVEDLAANKGGVNYGAKTGGSTFNFFKDAKYPTYQKMYEFMNDHPEFMTSTNAEGVYRVENENYAFLMESTTIEYITERRCTLAQVGKLLDEKGYGIAMRKNWPYRDILSQAVLELQEQGELVRMKTKWWKEKRGGGACTVTVSQDSAAKLGMANVGGIYAVLLGGSIIALCLAVLECVCHIYIISRTHKVPFKRELIDEIRFVLKCSGNTKPVKYRKTSTSAASSRSKLTITSKGSTLSVDSLATDDQQLHKHKV